MVYLIQCKKCGKQYVGQTMLSLKSRLSKHIALIKNPHQPGVLSEHFRKNKCAGLHNLQTQILQSIQRDSTDNNKTIENKLKSVADCQAREYKTTINQRTNHTLQWKRTPRISGQPFYSTNRHAALYRVRTPRKDVSKAS